MEQLIEQVINVIKTNDIASGVGVVGALTWIGYKVQAFLKVGSERLIRAVRFTTYFDNADNDKMYKAFSAWFLEKKPKAYKNTEMNISLDKKIDQYVAEVTQYEDFNWFWYKRNLIFVKKTRRTLENASYAEGMYVDSYKLTSFFGRGTIHKLKEELVEYYIKMNKEKEGVRIFTANSYGHVSTERNLKNAKTFDQIFFRGKEGLLSDIDNFIANEELYKKKNLRPKRSFLFDGPGGTGKTSAALAIALYLWRDVYMFNPTTFDNDAGAQEFFNSLPPKSIVLIEDIDRFYTHRVNVSDSTIFNCFDGVFSPSDVIIIATTNNKDKLDPIMIRSGRFDYHLEFGLSDSDTISEALSYFYDEPIKVECEPMAMSDVQELAITFDSELIKLYLNETSRTRQTVRGTPE